MIITHPEQEPCVVATLQEQNSVIFYDNDFEVFIDARASNHNYYEMEVSLSRAKTNCPPALVEPECALANTHTHTHTRTHTTCREYVCCDHAHVRVRMR